MREEGQEVLGWRDVPIDGATLGPTRAGEPARDPADPRRPRPGLPGRHELRAEALRDPPPRREEGLALRHPGAHALLRPEPLLQDHRLQGDAERAAAPRVLPGPLATPRVVTAIAMVHSRFSTNTFPSWSRAHPYRYISHNGEINTLRGNINWMHARQSMMRSALFGDDLQKILTVIDTEGSDSAMFDNVLELLTLTGRELPHAMMMMVPGAVEPARVDEPGEARVLRVPLLPHGAVGRPGVHRLHGRHPRRRGPRPQRPAALALLRHEGRPRRDGLRGRRPRHPARADRARRAGCSPGRMFLVDTVRGAHRLRRRAEGAHRRSSTRTASGWSATRSASTSCPRPRTSTSRTTRRCSGARRSSATPPRT